MSKPEKYHTWTIKEIDYIKAAYPTTSAGKIAIKMGTSTLRIEGTIARYKIKKNPTA